MGAVLHRHCERSEAIQFYFGLDCFVAYTPRNDERLHRRIDVTSAERMQAERRARNVEIEREVLPHGDHVAQVALQRIACVEALRAVAGP